MVRANNIQEKLLHLIGWEQNYDTSDLKISDALTVSESGLYFQQIHPLKSFDLLTEHLFCHTGAFQVQ